MLSNRPWVWPVIQFKLTNPCVLTNQYTETAFKINNMHFITSDIWRSKSISGARLWFAIERPGWTTGERFFWMIWTSSVKEVKNEIRDINQKSISNPGQRQKGNDLLDDSDIVNFEVENRFTEMNQKSKSNNAKNHIWIRNSKRECPMWMEGMGILGHMSFKSTFGAKITEEQNKVRKKCRTVPIWLREWGSKAIYAKEKRGFPDNT